MKKREEFYVKIKGFIKKIIENGKFICSLNSSILDELKQNKNVSNVFEINKIHFCIGLLQYQNDSIMKKNVASNKSKFKVETLDRFTLFKDNIELLNKLQNLDKYNNVLI